MTLYWSTPKFYVCMYILFVCDKWRPLVSVITTLYYVVIIVSLFMDHTYPIRYFYARFRFFCGPSIAELAHGEKSHTQSLTHSPRLLEAPRTEACASEQVNDYERLTLDTTITVHHIWNNYSIYLA